jgi:cyclopropane-fatty-acyl-phospholipid synthase
MTARSVSLDSAGPIHENGASHEDTRREATPDDRRGRGGEMDRRALQALLSPAGIEVDGSRPFDVRVLHDAFYERVSAFRAADILSAFVDGLWDTDRLDIVVDRVFRHGVALYEGSQFNLFLSALRARLTNLQTTWRSRQSIHHHYDLGNDLFQTMLDARMVYSCAYWNDTDCLDEAQEAKLEMVCRKLQLEPGQRVLDIGCGWGSFCKYAAERYRVASVGISNSSSQLTLAREMCAGLPVELKLLDYRALAGEQADAVVSMGMFEHVGYKNYRTFMRTARSCVRPDGRFLLHTIGSSRSELNGHLWIGKHIFPNAMLPSLAQITRAAEGVFVIEHVENIGSHYDKTLMAWYRNFERGWGTLRAAYGDRFYRLWKCYLLSCAGLFRARRAQVYQLVLSPSGVPHPGFRYTAT